MTTRFYPALIHKESKSDYGISFIDVPASSVGKTLDECLARAQEALNLVLEALFEDSAPIPAPTPLEKARAKLSVREKKNLVSVQLVPGTIPGKAVKVTISMDEELIKRVDAASGRYGRSRFLANAAKMKLAAGG